MPRVLCLVLLITFLLAIFVNRVLYKEWNAIGMHEELQTFNNQTTNADNNNNIS